MHRIKVLSLGSDLFNISLEELKEYLNFDLTISDSTLQAKLLVKHDIIFIHENFFKHANNNIEKLDNLSKIKILLSNSNNNYSNICDQLLVLPTTINVINQLVLNSITKKNFSKNSSIKIKNYILDKNEKKLSVKSDFILLTEKEIQLLELFLKNNKAINKNVILNEVWKYAADADTHTVETHIYRLRKKIKDKFSDENFILNNKNGYLF